MTGMVLGLFYSRNFKVTYHLKYCILNSENNDAGLVKIHKKRRLAASELGMGCETMYDKPLPSSLERTELPSTPEKKQASQPDTPQNVR